MLNTKMIIKPEDIIEIVLRRRWFIIIPFCFSVIVGIYLSITLPKVYQASTLILVQPQRVPTNYVRSVVSAGIESRINTISQQIMSRTNLEKIIDQFKLYSEPKYEKMYMEDKIEDMRERISVNIRSRTGADAFAISFEDTDPERVMSVANTMATYFIDENLKVREAQAVGTSNFLDDELTNIRVQLEELEEALREYRKRFMGELPEQLETNLRILDRLQEQLIEKQQSLRNTKNMLIAFEKQMSELYNMQNDLSIDSSVEFETEGSANLDQLKNQLSVLKTRYTDKHPDVMRIKRMIAELEKPSEEDLDQEISEGNEEVASGNNYQDLQMAQRDEMTKEIKAIETDISEIQKQTTIHQERVENTPKREQEILSLKRDYANIKGTYDSLLSRKLEAEISVNMEKKQKGEQFRVLDPARLPEKPIRPNMNRLFILTLAAGLAVGCGLVFLLEYFDTSFRRPEDIDSLLGLPVLAILPSLIHPEDIKKKKIYQFLSIFSIIIASFLLAGFAVLTFKGVDQTIEFVRSFVKI
ncbi:MAG: protein GumC [Proteobacteria bacterium]|nr:protein GumC [Pseudomonadota bacterium]MBU4288245.1 protein GumC [Pseudomonadota bacterium]